MSMVTKPDATISSRSVVSVQPPAQQFRVSPAAVQWTLMAGAGVLVIAYLVFAVNLYYLRLDFFGATFLYRAFNLNGEVTIPIWYSSSLLLVAALILAAISTLTLRLGTRHSWYWAGFCLLFLTLSIDESADIHGVFPFKLGDAFEPDGPLTSSWVIPGVFFTLIAVVLLTRFLRGLPRVIRRRFLLAGGLFVGGTLVMEASEIVYDNHFEAAAPYLMMVAIEEAMEMAGVIIFIAALLSYAASLGNRLQISFTPENEA